MPGPHRRPGRTGPPPSRRAGGAAALAAGDHRAAVREPVRSGRPGRGRSVRTGLPAGVDRCRGSRRPRAPARPIRAGPPGLGPSPARTRPGTSRWAGPARSASPRRPAPRPVLRPRQPGRSRRRAPPSAAPGGVLPRRPHRRRPSPGSTRSSSSSRAAGWRWPPSTTGAAAATAGPTGNASRDGGGRPTSTTASTSPWPWPGPARSTGAGWPSAAPVPGGLTALGALVRADCFAGAASWYGVTDLEALAADTHDFESHYLDSLVGPWPAAGRDLPGPLAAPPSGPRLGPGAPAPGAGRPGGAGGPVRAVRRPAGAGRGPVPAGRVRGEAHGFRRAETIEAALEAELGFYRDLFEPTQSAGRPGRRRRARAVERRAFGPGRTRRCPGEAGTPGGTLDRGVRSGAPGWLVTGGGSARRPAPRSSPTASRSPPVAWSARGGGSRPNGGTPSSTAAAPCSPSPRGSPWASRCTGSGASWRRGPTRWPRSVMAVVAARRTRRRCRGRPPGTAGGPGRGLSRRAVRRHGRPPGAGGDLALAGRRRPSTCSPRCPSWSRPAPAPPAATTPTGWWTADGHVVIAPPVRAHLRALLPLPAGHGGLRAVEPLAGVGSP